MKKALFVLVSASVLIAHTDTAPNTCVSTNQGAYVCTTDPLFVRKTLDQNDNVNLGPMYMSKGVNQIVDGSVAERQAVKDILVRMDDYLTYEVMSKKEYESVRSSCQNSQELCAFWASVNECDTNRVFMLNNCAAACRFCLLANSNLV